MQLLKAEMYKLFIKRFFLAVLILLSVYSSFSAAVKLKKNIKLDNTAFAAYKECMDKYCGEITDSKKAEIEEMLTYYMGLSKNIEELNKAYAEDKISSDEYNVKAGELNREKDKLPGINMFGSVYRGAVYENRNIIYELPWLSLFDRNSIDVFLVLTVILCVVLLTVYDEETGINILKFSTLRGKKVIAKLQTGIIFSLSFLICCLFSFVKLITVAFIAGISGFNECAADLSLFMNSNVSLSIMTVYMLSTLIKSFGCVFLSACVLSVGLMTRSSLNAVFAGPAIIYLPGYITYDFRIKYFLPLPSAFLSGEAYFNTVLIGETADNINYFIGTKTKIMLTVFLLLTFIIFFLLTFYSYNALAGRKEL